MIFLKTLFTILHIITAAAWFGMGLRLAAQARAVLGLDRVAALALADDAQRTVRLMGIFAVLTFIFAIITFALGSLAGIQYGGAYHTSMLLIVVLVAVQYALVQPAWKKLRDTVAGGGDAETSRKRIAMSVGIGHLIWLVLLVLMFWDGLAAAL